MPATPSNTKRRISDRATRRTNRPADRRTTRRTTRRSAAALAVALLAALVPAQAQAAAPVPPRDRLQQDADALRDAGVTGVSVRLTTPRGVRTVRSGVGDPGAGQPPPVNGYLRLGSTTKTFVATVLLQLAGEGRLSLDDTVDRWLPGVVRGAGNDGRRITLRQLLQHTSGVPDYIGDVVPDFSARGYLQNRSTTHTSAQRVAFAMTHPPAFAPGTRWEYSNTNYILLGMAIEAVTGRSWEQEVRARIIRPLRLTHTYSPGNDPALPRPHARNHQQFEPAGPMTDTTLAYLPFDGDADGALISTAADTNAFFAALLGGRLLAPAQLAEMRRTVAVPDEHGAVPGARHGLGLRWTPLTCGGGYWGHSGTGIGYMVWPAVMSRTDRTGATGKTSKGSTGGGLTAVTVSVHSRPGDEDTAVRQLKGVIDLVDHALCAAPHHR
ncbi:serine hydrolase domain-containing protein [Streptomyces paludis]|uniref:Class A beta-lactamase-related serine hydrolase n=1 Tax=Streptomyces paludis TaxID=2282738 RepID=A0A345HM03_9ACTN|nr:serine hydrolase domain-containing protein [Streptomyces paludis]AXG77727.1 class A beta-lactamase-related serine hydrolase [Streptomyces paludis]